MGKPTARHPKRSGKCPPHAQQRSGGAADEVLLESFNAPLSEAPSAVSDQPHNSFFSSLPPCIRLLRESTECAVLEDACNDIAYFGLQAKHNLSFLAEAVPQRLAQLLLFTSPYDPLPQEAEAGGCCSGRAAVAEEAVEVRLHQGMLYTQIAAAEALRSLITNSEQDSVADALTSAGVDAASGLSFSGGLATLVHADWQRVQQARRRLTPQDWMEVYHEAEVAEKAGTAPIEGAEGAAAAAPTAMPGLPHRHQKGDHPRSLYFTLLRHLEEVLSLASVCVEASEDCAAAFSEPSVLLLLLEVQRVVTTTAWETVLHPTARYYADVDHGADAAPAAGVSETVLAMRAYKQRETRLLASVAVVGADVLLLLSPDSPPLAQLFTGVSGCDSTITMTAEQRSFLNLVFDAVDLRAWLAQKPTAAAQLDEPLSDTALPSFVGAQPTVVGMERERVLYDLLRATLAMQGVLVHVAPVAANLQRVLPLLTDVMEKVSLPMHVWCSLLPLLMESADDADDEVRAAATTLAEHRLRSTQSCVRLLQLVVNTVCEHNSSRPRAGQQEGAEEEEEDEVAFAANPLAALLHSGNLFYLFGLLLKDVLWLSPSSGGGGPSSEPDVMLQLAQQRALRAAVSSNAAVTQTQMILLATEVTVWEVASTLLLMLPVARLGDPSLTWRALLQAVRSRLELHLEETVAAETPTGEASISGGGSNSTEQPTNILQHSARTRQLLWMQLESLGQMLWTMQRKQHKALKDDAQRNGVALTPLRATAADIDLFIKLSWEPAASPLLQQSCVGTVGLLGASLESVDAVAAATRYALAVAANGGSSSVAFGKDLQEVYTALALTDIPVDPQERRAWLQRLSLADAVVTVRCEAANTLVDLFLDERYDAMVYWPLGVQDCLGAFKTQLGVYVKRRRQLDKDAKRRYRLSTESSEAEQWAEILENLYGFLDYKAAHR